MQSLAEPEVSIECYQMAKRLIVEFDNAEVETQGVEQGKKYAKNRGTVLVFLPGSFKSFKLSSFKMVVHRAIMICSKTKLGSKMDTMKHLLIENGYPENFISRKHC